MPTSPDSEGRPAVLALAGRRVDAPDAQPSRFPAASIRQVQSRITEQFREERAATLVCSAACGADLLALAAADQLGIRSRIVLPFDREVFRRTSVTDRPGDWGEQYDRILDNVESRDDLVLLGMTEDDAGAYAAANEAILDEAVRLAQNDGGHVVALVVWDEQSRGSTDMTQRFQQSAERRGIPVRSVPTT